MTITKFLIILIITLWISFPFFEYFGYLQYIWTLKVLFALPLGFCLASLWDYDTIMHRKEVDTNI
jgi:ABC-type polysaccharide/polyol phosphate export permease